MAPKIDNISKFGKEQEFFANWAVDGKHDALARSRYHASPNNIDVWY